MNFTFGMGLLAYGPLVVAAGLGFTMQWLFYSGILAVAIGAVLFAISMIWPRREYRDSNWQHHHRRWPWRS